MNVKPSGGFGNDSFTPNQLVASTNNEIYAAWTDSRRGNTASAKQDIFSATVYLNGEAGYRTVSSGGAVQAAGNTANLGALPTTSAPIVGVASTPDGRGSWEVGSDGAVYPLR